LKHSGLSFNIAVVYFFCMQNILAWKCLQCYFSKINFVHEFILEFVYFQQYDFTKWGGMLFCCALVLFFLSIFTPIWLLLNTTVCRTIIIIDIYILIVKQFNKHVTSKLKKKMFASVSGWVFWIFLRQHAMLMFCYSLSISI